MRVCFPITISFSKESVRFIVLIHIHIFEAAVELAPKRSKYPLLDLSYHNNLIRGAPSAGKRGRPDILHRCLLILQDSILNHLGKLKVSFSTYSDPETSYIVDPSMRPPRSYTRFMGLIAELLRTGEIKSSLIRSTSTKELLNDDVHTSLLSKSGEKIGLKGFFSRISITQPQRFLIGGFQKGSWEKPLPHDEVLSLSDYTLSSSQVAGIVATLSALKLEGEDGPD